MGFSLRPDQNKNRVCTCSLHRRADALLSRMRLYRRESSEEMMIGTRLLAV